jgi:hypothetical protein
MGDGTGWEIAKEDIKITDKLYFDPVRGYFFHTNEKGLYCHDSPAHRESVDDYCSTCGYRLSTAEKFIVKLGSF